ncbi:hypothetical protein NRV55_000336 [Staphylococcus pseudintermedius]|nr:hypothetical protein [Staphylococcus pseudintermedius]
MANTVKCPYCEQQDNKENMIKVGRRYWHESCREQFINEQNEEEKRKLQEKEEYKELIEYICTLFNTDKPSGLVLKQIQTYHNTPYNYRYKAIHMALQYFYVIKNNSTRNSKGIGILPYIYDEAANFYRNLVRIQNTELKEKEEVKEVVVKKVKKNKKRKFDLNEL